MDAIRFRTASARAGGAWLCLVAWLLLGGAAPLRDAPVVWYDDDAHDIAPPAERDPNLTWDGIDATLQPVDRLLNFGRLARKVGTVFGGEPVGPASNVNALDEVPNSTWFTNRIGLFPMTPEAVATGPGSGEGPDRSAPWTLVGAKTEGVTPGFRIRDVRGDVYLIKFDPPAFNGMASAAGVISGKLFHAIGYNVPEDAVVYFKRSDVVLGEGVKIKDETGEKRPMTDTDVDDILHRVTRESDGSYRAVASKFLSGKPAGPFDWRGRRKDDPNDRISHENRRELRGLRLFAAWLNHFDTKQGNTLDMLVEEDGRRFLRHHLLDFASSLGAGATGPHPTFGFEYTLDFPAVAGRTLALGLHEDAWRRLELPDSLTEIGYFESREFDPDEWKPLAPNASFANLTSQDAYWAAKILSAFTDQHLRAAVETGHYRDPAAAEYMTRILAERRDKIARTWFDRVPPLDFFSYESAVLRFHDLGTERGIYPEASSRYRVRSAWVTADRKEAGLSAWSELTQPELPAEPALEAGAPPPATHPFRRFELQVDRGKGWSRSVGVVIARASGHVVEVSR